MPLRFAESAMQVYKTGEALAGQCVMESLAIAAVNERSNQVTIERMWDCGV